MAGGRKNKRKKIAEVNTLPNVFQCPEYHETQLYDASGQRLDLKGHWNELVFKNNHPITLELACGKGDYAVALAARYPDRNFIGVDIKGPRIHTGAKQAHEQGLHNVAFARIKIQNILNFFGTGEIDEIWITFPDPYPKDRHEKHRLTYKEFLAKYEQVLKPGGVVNFKMDDMDMFHYTRDSALAYGGEILYYQEDIYSAPLEREELSIKTFYEKQHIADGRKINYLRFRFKS
ncbi:MAG: tRNA (guanosine(46)-N7)-methyltransferase TrmB [Bacteroidetes bacterium]|nr:tRNA (guanosine(46)-N7)-methyltransferase TrmB [Bacteroidota bacterium]